MKTFLKIALTLSMFGFALTTNAQSYDMLDIVKVMNKPAKQKISGKKSKEAKKSRSTVAVESGIPTKQNYGSKIADVDNTIQIEASADGKLLNIQSITTGSVDVSPNDQQGTPQHEDERKGPAIADPKLHRISPRVD